MVALILFFLCLSVVESLVTRSLPFYSKTVSKHCSVQSKNTEATDKLLLQGVGDISEAKYFTDHLNLKEAAEVLTVSYNFKH